MDLGERFARALAAKDVVGLRSVLAPDVDFRAMTPKRFWESSSAEEVVSSVLLGTWFKPSDRIEALVSVSGESVADRERVTYRLRVGNDDGPHLVEQVAYYAADGDRITWLRVMCAGYRPVPVADGRVTA
ncbi:MAG TPA: hypothetical protein VNA20_05625 [Frankiaceae bacterium]|nr:hypothetical protein [Frankiaceae bacterium]